MRRAYGVPAPRRAGAFLRDLAGRQTGRRALRRVVHRAAFFGRIHVFPATDAVKVATRRPRGQLRARAFPMNRLPAAQPRCWPAGSARSRVASFCGRLAALYTISGTQEKWTCVPTYRLPHAILQFYVTAPYPCHYLPGAGARLSATPSHLINTSSTEIWVKAGFRAAASSPTGRTAKLPCLRAGAHPPVARFSASRSQRRAWQQHAELTAQAHAQVPPRSLSL